MIGKLKVEVNEDADWDDTEDQLTMDELLSLLTNKASAIVLD